MSQLSAFGQDWNNRQRSRRWRSTTVRTLLILFGAVTLAGALLALGGEWPGAGMGWLLMAGGAALMVFGAWPTMPAAHGSS
jgi:hypothetical protein